MLRGKKILLGITGGIAAYKIPVLIRLLVQEGCEVQVLMTPFAKHFVTPLTLATLSGNSVYTDFYSSTDGSWNSHVNFGRWGDLFLIAPLTANSIGKMVHGIADNLLLATYLAAECPVMVAPAMDANMYRHPVNKRNLELLASYGVHILEPNYGELASGLYGPGRMEQPSNIVESIRNFFYQEVEKKN